VIYANEKTKLEKAAQSKTLPVLWTRTRNKELPKTQRRKARVVELTILQLDEIRAKQREDEAVRRMSGTSGRLLDKLTRPIDAHTARLAIEEVDREYAANPLLGRKAPRA
jgi:hypothetical protein